jgi:hypothetical protein
MRIGRHFFYNPVGNRTHANPVRVAHPFSPFNGPLDGTLVRRGQLLKLESRWRLRGQCRGGGNSPHHIPLKNPSDFHFMKTFDHRIYLTALRSLILRQVSGHVFDQKVCPEVFQRNPHSTFGLLVQCFAGSGRSI